MSTRRLRSVPTLALASALCTTVLAGCAQLPAVRATGATDQVPLVVQPAQAGRVVAAAGEVLGAASDLASTDLAGTDPASTDLAALATRVGGPELDFRTAAATVAQAGSELPATSGADDLEALTSVLPRQREWPRWFLTVTGPGPDQLPSLVLFRSASARDPYEVWATPSFLPGQSLPALVAPADGVAVVAPDEDTNLPLSPAEVVDHYADVLTAGDASAFAAEFAADGYRDSITASTDQERRALEAAGGSLTQERTVLPDSLVAARTRDGGALVLAGYRWSTTSAGPAGGLRGHLEAPLAALAGRADTIRATVVREEVLAFVVPPGEGSVVSVLAAQSGIVSVEAS